MIAAGCATNAWVTTQIEENQKKHRSELGAMTQQVQQSLAQEAARNQDRARIIDGLPGEIQRLDKELGALKAGIESLRSEVDARLKAQEKEMTEAFGRGDEKVHGELLAKHQESVDAIRQEMQRVDTANKHADQLAQTLQEMAAVYRSIAQDTADEYKALESSVGELSPPKTASAVSTPATAVAEQKP